MNKFYYFIGILFIGVVFVFGGLYFYLYKNKNITIESFEDCTKKGYPVLESYPRQCVFKGKHFTEDIGNELEKSNLIRVNNPRPNQKIESPLEISGEARGYWFFEASFSVHLYDENGKEISVAVAQAESEWMTEEFVPFKAVMEFKNSGAKKGFLIFRKDNPSGLSEYDDELRMPIKF